ncbi:MAG: thioredoxin family protein [Candidatus Shapirobacteria bacterium]
MKIQVLGSGCPTCKNLYELTKKAVKELGIKVEVEYSTDISKIIEMGIMQSPVMAIDGKPVMTGSGSLEKIKEIISKDNNGKIEETEKSKCTCEDGDCGDKEKNNCCGGGCC